jgi:hypothetical protein
MNQNLLSKLSSNETKEFQDYLIKNAKRLDDDRQKYPQKYGAVSSSFVTELVNLQLRYYVKNMETKAQKQAAATLIEMKNDK